MGASTPPLYNEIDWAKIRANAMEIKGWRSKSSKDWDKKARSFSGRNKSTAYIELFLSHLPAEPSMTVLDVGSGPGTLAIPLARKSKKVTAIDFSQGMLDTLVERAQEENIENITTVQCAWEDDWEKKGLLPHDIAIASRSMGVKDLETALRKINRYGSKFVFLSDRIGSTPFEVGAFSALGRPFSHGPDYIFTLNTLYTLDIHPNVTILTLDSDTTYSSMAEAIKSYSWMFQDISSEELISLEKYITSQIVHSEGNEITVRRQTPPRWALIWWQNKSAL